MSIIRILPEEISNRIAAGEVVERPASIVKELVENSLDAGATRVLVTVERGGHSLVRVVDDGCGMDAEDALLCLEAHATSKIRETADIERIGTLGFRGEALPSIASVTHFRLETRLHDAPAGTLVVVDGGEVRQVEATGCAPGTAISARNLFFNMPARRKFLRTVQTEESHLQEMVLTQALAHPEVAFELYFDGRQVLAVQSGSDLRTRATLLLGKDLMQGMLAVQHEEAGIRVHGFVARPGLTRTTRREQRTFVNGRAVEAQQLYQSIRDAYHTLVMKGRYPPVLLFLELGTDRVDINVHPAKREVRFREVRLIGDVVANAVRQALRHVATGREYSPGPTGNRPEFVLAPPPAPPPAPPRQQELPDIRGAVPRQVAPTAPAAESQSVPPPPGPVVIAAPPEEEIRQPEASPSVGLADLRILGHLNQQYLVAEGPVGLVLIDKQAAHERILFEQFLRRAGAQPAERQGLLIPVTVDLSPTDAATLTESLEEFGAMGFDIESFGQNTFIVRAVPPQFPQRNIRGLLRDMLDDLRENSPARKRIDQRLLAGAACRAAVRARTELKEEEISHLLQELSQTELPYTCPRGKPTMINFSFQELNKRFGNL